MEFSTPTSFRAVAAASKHIKAFFADHSFLKTQRKLEIREKKVQSLTHKLTLNSFVHASQEYHQRVDFDQKVCSLQHSITAAFRALDTFHHAAVSIQRAYRAHRTRRSVDSTALPIQSARIRADRREQSALVFQLNYHVGLLPDQAATVLQKAVQRFLFARKIARIKHAYELMLEQRKYVIFASVLGAVHMFNARSKVRWKKLKELRVKRLAQIQRRCAVLTIKQFWVRNEFNSKKLRKRIRRYKRKLQEPAKATTEEGQQQDEEDAPPADEEEDSEEERQRELLRAQRKHRVKMGKISYHVPKLADHAFSPLRGKEPSVIDPVEALALKIAQEEAAPAPEPPGARLFDRNGKPTFPLVEPLPPAEPPLWVPTRKYKGFGPRYMQNTVASHYNRNPELSSYVPDFMRRKSPQSKRSQSTFMEYTQAATLKKHDKVEQSSPKLWKPSTVVQLKFVPSVTSYSPSSLQMRAILRPPKLPPLSVDFSRPSLPPEVDVHLPKYSVNEQIHLPVHVAQKSQQFFPHTKPRLPKVTPRPNYVPDQLPV